MLNTDLREKGVAHFSCVARMALQGGDKKFTAHLVLGVANIDNVLVGCVHVGGEILNTLEFRFLPRRLTPIFSKLSLATCLPPMKDSFQRSS